MKNKWICTVCGVFIVACYDFSLPKGNGGLDGSLDGGNDASIDTINAGDDGAGPCGVGGLQCNNSCVANDKENCGGCGHDCMALPHVNGPVDCINGVCVAGSSSCAPGWAHCSQTPDDGCETDLSKPADCGICDNDCSQSTAGPVCAPKGAAGQSPAAYECMSQCPPNAPIDCGDKSCVDLNASPTNCGRCGISCRETERGQAICEAGNCTMVCNPGSHQCGEKCVSNTSPDSCGAACEPCDVPLNSIPSCDGTKCGFKCKEGYLECDKKCVPNDERNCGKCGNDCSSIPNVSGKASCIKGVCTVTDSSCDPGYAHCSKNSEDKCETDLSNPANCGKCGNKCPESAPDCTLKAGPVALQ
jgi:hypothetical protein